MEDLILFSEFAFLVFTPMIAVAFVIDRMSRHILKEMEKKNPKPKNRFKN